MLRDQAPARRHHVEVSLPHLRAAVHYANSMPVAPSRGPGQGAPDLAPSHDCGATSIYLYCADRSVSGFDVSFLIWNTLTVRSERSPFSSNDTTPWMVGTFAVWIASRTFSRVIGLPDLANRWTLSIITSDASYAVIV